MTTTQPTRRYYAYSNILGRKRIPDATTDTDAVTWAINHGAVNVICEEGPIGNPTTIAFVWKADTPNANPTSNGADNDIAALTQRVAALEKLVDILAAARRKG